jgi:hypothetical protein
VSTLLALPWYGIGGVPAIENEDVNDPNPSDITLDEDAATALARLNMDAPPAITAGGSTEEEHVSQAQKRRARRKRAKDSAHKLRRSSRLMAKEEPGYEPPEKKAARVQQAKFDFTGASRRLRDAISRSYLISNSYYPSDDNDSLSEIAAACGASEGEIAGIFGATASPSTGS